MNITKKILVYFILFIPAAIIAAIYGVIHDQISYSFSPEYFTHFKFIQFGIPWAQESPRLGAALVGALATWWMGILVFLILGLFGFIFPDAKTMCRELLRSFILVIITALATGLAGLLYAYLNVTESNIQYYLQWVQPEVSDPVQFVRVGLMHNASYLGGLTGLLAGIAYLLVARKRYQNSSE